MRENIQSLKNAGYVWWMFAVLCGTGLFVVARQLRGGSRVLSVLSSDLTLDPDP